jgi:hypothetical protein
MWWVFLLLYVSYIILGPHWETKLLGGQKLDIVKSSEEFFRRSMFISYVALLFISWFLYSPSQTAFISALMITLMAMTGFHIKFGPEEPIPVHALLVVYLLYQGRWYMSFQLWLTVALAFFYTAMHEKLYIQ